MTSIRVIRMCNRSFIVRSCMRCPLEIKQSRVCFVSPKIKTCDYEESVPDECPLWNPHNQPMQITSNPTHIWIDEGSEESFIEYQAMLSKLGLDMKSPRKEDKNPDDEMHITIRKDGEAWFAHDENFRNLQESDAVFAFTPQKAAWEFICKYKQIRMCRNCDRPKQTNLTTIICDQVIPGERVVVDFERPACDKWILKRGSV